MNHKRTFYSGCILHVMARGVRRTNIFREAMDYRYFLKLLKKFCKQCNIEVICWCLMTNHFHLLIKTNDIHVGNMVRSVLSAYAKYFNKKYGFEGHLFDKRFTSCLVEKTSYFLEVSRYIHLNPVKAGLVKNPIDYKYSSYGLYVNEKHDDFTVRDRLLGEINDDPDVAAQIYKIFVEGSGSHKKNEDLIRAEMKEDEQWMP
ncbi:MAG: transposase [Eubacteriales bacterium]|nr:transposase [Eubacteriales bacterium]